MAAIQHSPSKIQDRAWLAATLRERQAILHV